MIRAGRRAALACALPAALAGLALTGCETTQEKSAKLEKVALAKARNAPLGAHGLVIAKPSRTIHVASSAVVSTSEGAAAVVVLRNDGPRAQREVPLAVTVHGAGGTSLYSNSAAGLAPALVSAAYVPAHGQATWVDDQVQTASKPSSVTAEAGEGKPVAGAPPQIATSGVHRVSEPGGVASVQGTVANRSAVPQRELVVFALARRGSQVTAAGRAVIHSLAGHASARFQIFLVGSVPSGARVTVTAPATSF